MKGKKTLVLGLAVFVFCGFLPATTIAGEYVTVYGEAAYTPGAAPGGEVEVRIYLDTGGSLPAPLCSFGIKLTYPSDLTLVTDPNETGTDKSVWYLDTEDYTDVYPSSTDPEVVLIGGKLDPDDQGVQGTRKPVATVKFTHDNASMPPAFTLELGRTGDYKNFVCTNSTVVEDPPIVNGVDFDHPDFDGVQQVKSARRGDADADGFLTNSDFFEIRNLMGSGTYKVYADGDGDGYLTNSDFFWLRNNM